MKKNIIESRLDGIEELLKMLLINSVIDKNDIEETQKNILKDLEEPLQKLKITNLRFNYIEGKYYLFAETDENLSLKAVKANYEKARAILTDNKLVLVFDKMHSKRKEAFNEAKISYWVNNGEARFY